MWQDLAAAFGLFLILEGLLPFVAPNMWKNSFRRILEFSEGQLRTVGLVSIVAGLLLYLWVV
jgi:uncharacterized protein